MGFFDHWSEALKPDQSVEPAQQHKKSPTAETDPAVPSKFKKVSVHRFDTGMSIYVHEPSGRVKVYYREIPH